MQLDVCGLGNALMDVLIRLDDDAVLKTLGLRKGIMHLVDAEAWSRAYEAVRHLPTEVSPGGSCANTQYLNGCRHWAGARSIAGDA